MQYYEVPRLLAMLLETVDDPRMFTLTYVPNPEGFKQELRQAWAALYFSAAYCWDDMNTEMFEGDPPEIFGPAMCERFDQLSSCWLEDFRNAAMKVAARKDLPEKGDRAFLYFMLGVLWLSWRIYLIGSHGKTEAAS